MFVLSKFQHNLDLNFTLTPNDPKFSVVFTGLFTHLACACSLPLAPAVSAPHMHMSGSTHYDQEFNDTDGRGGPQHVRNMAKALGAQSIQNYLNTATGKGRLIWLHTNSS